MNSSMPGSGGRRCARADALLGVEGVHISSVTATTSSLVLRVETGEDLVGYPDCGVVAVGDRRRQVRLHDIPCFGRPVRLLWAKRVWHCPDPGCPRTTFTEEHPLAGPRARLTARAVVWATDALQHFDTSVSALAHQLGVSWHTAWDVFRAEAARRVGATGRWAGVDAFGVDEHVWSTVFPAISRTHWQQWAPNASWSNPATHGSTAKQNVSTAHSRKAGPTGRPSPPTRPRTDALQPRQDVYNNHRPHGSLGGKPPISRCNQAAG
jgi:hypothetical protein